MGFLSGLGRFISGKPVFVDEGVNQSRPPAGTNERTIKKVDDDLRLVDGRGYKIIPELALTHVTSRVDGKHMTVTAWVTNSSKHVVRIDESMLLKQRTVLYRQLSPGEGREVTLYHGPVPTNDHEHKAQIVYRLMENGDRFQASYSIKYCYDDGHYEVDELHPEYPIRDV